MTSPVDDRPAGVTCLPASGWETRLLQVLLRSLVGLFHHTVLPSILRTADPLLPALITTGNKSICFTFSRIIFRLARSLIWLTFTTLQNCGLAVMIRKIEYLEDMGFVKLTTSGKYELSAEVQTLERMVAALKENNCNRCMFDHRAASVMAPTLISYERSALYEKLWGDRSIRAAVVFQQLTEDYCFLETAARNQGWNIRIFDDYEQALSWLTA